MKEPQDTESSRQRLLEDLWDLFTLSGPDVVARFNDSRIKSDHDRINLAVEFIAPFIQGAEFVPPYLFKGLP